MAANNSNSHSTERLSALRALMAAPQNSLDALVIPSEDQHSSEYIAPCDMRRAFITGFTGSAGTAIVTTEEAFFFTDGRYHLQATQQLDSNWSLMKVGLPDVLNWDDFLKKKLGKNKRIGIDPALIPAKSAESLQEALKGQKSELIGLSSNLVDEVWGESRPKRPSNPVFVLDTKFSGQSISDKLNALRTKLKDQDKQAMVISMLDEVAWMLNLRGSDIDYNPVFFSYLVVSLQEAILYISPEQVNEEIKSYLNGQVVIRPYESFMDDLRKMGESLTKEKSILLGTKSSLAIASALGKDKIDLVRSPVADLKSIKNPVELEGFRQCHIRDGVALARYFAWLEEQLHSGKKVDECEGADRLEGFRSELEHYKGLSFDTISASGPNGAIIHYSPQRETCAVIRRDQIYLCDSGAQFLDGTTDTTRTWHFGTPTDEERHAYTRVLQGHIAIDTLLFPEGISGYVLDTHARRPLWEAGLDYRHGTGHGVGHFLNVHEGPQGITITRPEYRDIPMKEGMVTSNEPGVYLPGKFGIRIENIVLVVKAPLKDTFENRPYFAFEHVTMSPLCSALIDTTLLSPKERAWVNGYHRATWEKVSGLLEHDRRALKWLERECRPL